MDLNKVSFGLYASLLTVSASTDPSYPPLRIAVTVTVYPPGDIKTVPSTVTLSPDTQKQTIAVAFQGSNNLSSASATVADFSKDPVSPGEGDWLAANTDCIGITLTSNNSCTFSFSLDASKLNSSAVVGRTYTDRVILRSGAGDRADIIVQFNYTRALLPPLFITSGNSFSGTATVPFTAAQTASGGSKPYTWTVSGLPAGLSYDSSTGVISGVVAQALSADLSVSVRDSAGTLAGPQTVTLTFTPPASSITQMLPHIADGGEWQTDILLINSNSNAVTVDVVFHLDNGATTIPVSGLGSVSSIPGIVIAAQGSVLYRTAGSPSAPSTTGWAEVKSALPIDGQALFRRHAGVDGKYYEGTVPMVAPVTSFRLPFDGVPFADQTPIFTGLAIANAATSQTQISCTAFNASGAILAPDLNVSLGPLAHWAALLQNTDPFKAAVGTTRGVLACTSSQPLGVLGLRAFGFAAISSLPIF